MKKTGITPLLIGFLWISFAEAIFAAVLHNARGVVAARKPRAGGTLPRDDVNGALGELCREIQTGRSNIFIPAVLMLTGGLMASSGRVKNERGTNAMDSN